MFCLKEKFDIVIGNPPYISTKGVKEEDKVKYERSLAFLMTHTIFLHSKDWLSVKMVEH